ncbi:MAG: ACT domain-containing protein [Candidatus Limnocylindrales bacterium]
MKAFVVATEDRPGEIARISEAIGTAGVNITALAGLTGEAAGLIGFLVSDEAGARGALRSAGIEAQELEVIRVALADEPGALAKAARKLATAGINVELILSTGVSHGKGGLVLAVSDARRARTLLGDLVLED